MSSQGHQHESDQVVVDQDRDDALHVDGSSKRSSLDRPKNRADQHLKAKTNFHDEQGRYLHSKKTGVSPQDREAGNSTHEFNEERHADAGKEDPLPIERFLQGGDSLTPRLHKERNRFEKGGPGMRRYLDHWQDKWNAITKRNSH